MQNANERYPQTDALPALSVLKMFWNRRWLILACWLIASAAGGELISFLPPMYKAEAVVLVDSQKIPQEFVTPTVTGDIADRLALISQSIMTSDRLLDLIHTFGLYRQESARLTQEDLLRKMRDDISVKVEKSWTGGRMQAFRLGYTGYDPKTVAKVTNRLAGLYVAENVRTRQSQAVATVDFLHQQLDDAKMSLDKQEAQLASFKLAHNGSLPEQENALLGNLSSLRIELQGVQDSISQAQQNKESLEAALGTVEQSTAISASGEGGPVSSDAPSKVEALENQLRTLRLRYTPDFPEIQNLLDQIQAAKREEMQNQVAAASAGTAHSPVVNSLPAAETSKSRSSTSRRDSRVMTERIASLRSQIGSTERHLNSLQSERQDLLAKISECEHRVGQLPLIEQQMAGLKRNYEESANHYNSLLQKKMSASMATDMERSDDSERFAVIDPARVPQKPVKPKRMVLAAIGSFGGLAIGLALSFFLEFKRQTVLGEWELPKDIPVLGRIPTISPVRQVPSSGIEAVS